MLKKTFKKILPWIVVILIFFFLFKSIVTNYNLLKTYQWHFNYWILILAFLLLFPAMFLLAKLWSFIIVKMSNINFSFSEAFKIYFIANLGRYIPGKVWQFFAMAYLAKDKGLSLGIAFSTAVIGQILILTSGLILSFLFIGPSIHKIFNNVICWLFFLGFLIFLIILFFKPKIIENSVNYIAKKTGKSPSFRLDFKPAQLLILLFFYIIVWIIICISAFLIIRSFTPMPFENLTYIIGAYSAASVIGFLAIFTPGGLGVREGIMTVLLSTAGVLPAPVASIASILIRIVVTLNELSLFFISLALIRKEDINEIKAKYQK